MHSIISITDFSREDIEALIYRALEIKRNEGIKNIDPRKVASLFFENSRYI